MKKGLALLLAGAMALSLAACSQSSTTDTADTTSTTQATTSDTSDGLGDYPSKNISWIVAADAGAPLDIPTRAIIDNMDIDTNVIVENISGASNTIGTLEAVMRDADGYTLVTTASAALLLQPLMTDLAYDPADLRVISLVRPLSTYAVVVGPDSPLDTPEDFIELVQSGDRFTYTVSNAGTASHLATVDALGQLGGDAGVFVPYNGGSEVKAALINNEIDFAVLDTPENVVAANKGEQKVLMIMSDVEDPIAPGIAPISDYGVEGMNAYFGIQCVAVRRDTPEEIVDFLKEKINEAISTDEYQQFLIDAGNGEMGITDEAALEAELVNAREVYAVLLKELGMID